MSTPDNYNVSPDFVEHFLNKVLSAIAANDTKRKITRLKKKYLRLLDHYNETFPSNPIAPHNFDI